MTPDIPYSSEELLLDTVAEIKSMLIILWNGGSFDDERYQYSKRILIQNQKTRELLPLWLLSSFDGSSLYAHFDSLDIPINQVHSYIARELDPAIQYLLSKITIHDIEISGALSSYDNHSISAVWKKALERKNDDPEGAITVARTLIEELCKHILDDLKIEYDEKCDLPKLYNQCAKSLNLGPSQHTEQQFKQILGGCQSVVEGMGSLRNKLSDAHGGGRKRVKPAPRHAALAVNLAGSMAMFLIETFQARKDEGLGESNAA